MAITTLLTPFFQKINGAVRKVLFETIASQVKTADGSDVQTKLTAMSEAISGQTKTIVVADIAARDAVTGMKIGDQCWVKDASGDATVTKGAAKYIYESEEAGWVKSAEAESMDLVIKWADIQDKPDSAVADIDAAVTAVKPLSGHELTVSDDTGELLLDGGTVGGKYGAYVAARPEDEGFEAAVAALGLPDGAFFTVAETAAGTPDNPGEGREEAA